MKKFRIPKPILSASRKLDSAVIKKLMSENKKYNSDISKLKGKRDSKSLRLIADMSTNIKLNNLAIKTIKSQRR